MYLQGNLQAVFDALYNLGVIDPVLSMDWSEVMDEIADNYDTFSKAVAVANTYQDDVDTLMDHLEDFEDSVLGYLAIEVAKEYADFHSRDESLH